jgi:cytochrome P450 family 110
VKSGDRLLTTLQPNSWDNDSGNWSNQIDPLSKQGYRFNGSQKNSLTLESAMSLPDGPQSPDLWQQLRWLATPFSFMRDSRRRYGESFTVATGRGKLSKVVFASHPKDLELILSNDDGELFDVPGELNTQLEPLLGTESVIGLSDNHHRRARKLLLPPFHGERMRSYAQLIGEIALEVLNEQPSRAFSVRKLMQTISMRVILQAVFGLRHGVRYQRLEKVLGRMLDRLASPLSVSFLFFPVLQLDFGPLSPWGSFVRDREEINYLIFEEIAERRAHPDVSRNDILSLLMGAQDEGGEAPTDAELRDELMTLLAAGHETTATALTWALYWIHKLPSIRQQLVSELQSLGDTYDPSAVFRLPYLNAVCSETLRIYPVGILTFARVTKTRVQLRSALLEAGTVVVGCIYLAHRREDVYPDPEQFRPERFLERRYSPFEYLPFGGGARRCIGMAFAQFEMKLVISQILSNFELAFTSNRPVRLGRRGITSGPSPFRMVMTRRWSESPASTAPRSSSVA